MAAKKATSGTPTLGDLVRDKITGFEGIVVAETRWLNNCVRLSVQSRKLKDDQKPVDMTFDITDIELLEKDPLGYRKPEGGKTGGPRPDPVRTGH